MPFTTDTCRSLIGGALLFCASCASLPGKETADFQRTADAQADAFDAAAQTSAQASADRARDLLGANEGRVAISGCGPDDVADCVLTYTVRPPGDDTKVQEGDLPLDPAAPAQRRLAAAIGRYGGRLSELGAADDIAALNAGVAAAAGAASSLATAVGVPIAPLIGLTSLAVRSRIVERRRRLLLEVATKADPVVQAAATRMTRIARELRDGIADNQTRQVARLRSRIDLNQAAERKLAGRTSEVARRRREQLATERVADFDSLVVATRTLTAARHLPIDYSALAASHGAMIAALRDGKADTSAAIASANEFAGIAADAAAMLKPGDKP